MVLELQTPRRSHNNNDRKNDYHDGSPNDGSPNDGSPNDNGPTDDSPAATDDGPADDGPADDDHNVAPGGVKSSSSPSGGGADEGGGGGQAFQVFGSCKIEGPRVFERNRLTPSRHRLAAMTPSPEGREDSRLLSSR